MTREQIEQIGLCADDDMTGFYNIDGCSYDCLDSAIWCGIFGFCGCGNKEYELERLYQTLKIIDREDFFDRAEILPYKNGYHIYLYLLNSYQFARHSYTIEGSVLTEKGKALMYVLRHVLGHDIEDAEL